MRAAHRRHVQHGLPGDSHRRRRRLGGEDTAARDPRNPDGLRTGSAGQRGHVLHRRGGFGTGPPRPVQRARPGRADRPVPGDVGLSGAVVERVRARLPVRGRGARPEEGPGADRRPGARRHQPRRIRLPLPVGGPVGPVLAAGVHRDDRRRPRRRGHLPGPAAAPDGRRPRSARRRVARARRHQAARPGPLRPVAGQPPCRRRARCADHRRDRRRRADVLGRPGRRLRVARAVRGRGGGPGLPRRVRGGQRATGGVRRVRAAAARALPLLPLPDHAGGDRPAPRVREDREWAWTHVAPQLESALADVESALRTGE